MKTRWIAAAVILASAGTFTAHHALTQFDTVNPVTVKGKIVLFERVNPHSVLFVDQKDSDGKTHRWAVTGPPVGQLSRKGIEKDALKAGDVIEVCGYAAKGGAEFERTLSPETAGANLKTISGRLMDGELLIMPDGHREVWSDYGYHKCLGPDYHDAHAKRVE
jgi:Family of unknown function (DUF6152)